MYQERFEISSHDIDPDGIVRPSCLLRYMQESANHQMRDEGPSYMELFDEGKAFILSRMVVHTYAPLHQYEQIDTFNWPSEGKGATFYRCHRIERDGKVVAEALGYWALVDIHTHKLYRVGEVTFPNYTQGELKELDGVRFRLPEQMTFVGKHIVAYHETDCNRHLNNTKYAEIITDLCTDELEKKRIRDFRIVYAGEARVGDTVEIFRENDVFFGTRDGERCFEAEVGFEQR